LLVVGEPFIKEKENDEFRHRWHIDPSMAQKIHESLRKLYKNLSDDDLVSEPDFVSSFLEHLKEVSDEMKNEEVLKRWLAISKMISKNPLGEWGKSDSPNIKSRGIRDYAFLTLRRHGSPIHFKDVAKSIEKLFGKKAGRISLKSRNF